MIKLEDVNITNRISVDSFLMKERCCGVIGPNGAGKSSFLKVIAGLVDYEGKVIREGDCTFCGDATVLQSDMQAKEVLYYARGNKAQNLEFLNELTRHFRFQDLLKRSVSTLSSGEKQRLNLISAFYYECEYTLLDEPTNYLDPIYIDLLAEYIESWKKKVFIVSHDLNFIMENTQQLASFNQGEISFNGKTVEAFDKKVFDKVFHKKFNYQLLGGRRYIL